MSDPSWEVVRRLFAAAIQLPRDEREDYLRARAGSDGPLLEEALSLVGHHRKDTGFLRPVTQARMLEAVASTGASTPPELPRDTVLADRYVIGDRIGSGGIATVYAARDRISEGEVAVKVLHRDGTLGVVDRRRECALLRLLDLPGVVGLLDEGEVADPVPVAFLVMDRVHGTPFPGRPGPLPWAELELRACALAEILAHVHQKGVVHRDVKPSNVLIDEEGRPWLLDLGIAVDGPADWDEGWERLTVGTPAFAAPEQLEGEGVTPRTDVFAFGLLLRRSVREAPPALDALLDRCVAHDPGARPASMVEVWSALARLETAGARRPCEGLRSKRDLLDALRANLGERNRDDADDVDTSAAMRLPRETLAALFRGPQRVHFLVEDAVDALLRRTDATAPDVLAELGAWVRGGLARWGEGGLTITRPALERLDGGVPTRPVRALEASEHPSRTLHARVTADLASGHAARAHETLCRSLIALRGRDALTEILPLLVPLVRSSLHTGTKRALDLALYHLGRLPAEPEVARAGIVARAALSALQGDHQQALALLCPHAHLLDDEVGFCIHSIRLLACRFAPQDVEEATLRDLEARLGAAPSDLYRTALLESRGWCAYRAGRYDDAVEAHRCAATVAPTPALRLTTSLSAASSAMEASRFDDAARMASEALETAETLRHAPHAARAEWILRSALYRQGGPLAPDRELVEAVRKDVAPNIRALISLTEAAIAWRAGDGTLAAALAGDAAAEWQRAGRGPPRDLARALAFAAGGDTSPEDVDAMIEQALACPLPGIAIQILGLVASQPRGGESPHLPDRRTWSTKIPAGGHDDRREVLSVAEAVAFLQAARTSDRTSVP